MLNDLFSTFLRKLEEILCAFSFCKAYMVKRLCNIIFALCLNSVAHLRGNRLN